jgi:hypothetical protein
MARPANMHTRVYLLAVSKDSLICRSTPCVLVMCMQLVEAQCSFAPLVLAALEGSSHDVDVAEAGLDCLAVLMETWGAEG